MAKAVEWGVGAFRAAGVDVHTEKYTLPLTWSEGKTRVSGLAIPRPVPPDFEGTNFFSMNPTMILRAVSEAWGPPTPEKGIAGDVVDVGYGSEAEVASLGPIWGAILLVHSDIGSTWADLFNEYLRPPDIISHAVKDGATAIFWMGARERLLLYRHTNSLNGEIDKMPQAVVVREDAMRLARTVEAYPGRVRVHFDMPNKVGGPIGQENVVGEIRGREKPEESVILGAHLDSWEFGTGALDNGCNAAMVIEAARPIN